MKGITAILVTLTLAAGTGAVIAGGGTGGSGYSASKAQYRPSCGKGYKRKHGQCVRRRHRHHGNSHSYSSSVVSNGNGGDNHHTP